LEQRATENYQSKGVRNAWLMRAIISNINSAFQNLSTWLVNELSQLKQVTRMYVKNSTQFCQQLKDVTLQKIEVLVSIDVISLFPTVPVEAEDMQRWFQEINFDDSNFEKDSIIKNLD
jgi:hypothetical protein